MEYYIHNIPLFVVDEVSDSVSIPELCQEIENLIPQESLFSNVDVFYIGNFKELKNHNAAFSNGAIYISNKESTNADLIEDIVHELAHSLEQAFSGHIYSDEFINEFKSKRRALKRILDSEGYKINSMFYDYTEYNKKFDDFLSNKVGYPKLLNLTRGLFASPYGATSIREYFANGFEKYVLDNPSTVEQISPVLYRKMQEIIDA